LAPIAHPPRRQAGSPPARLTASRTLLLGAVVCAWPATSGADAYRIRFDYYENNALKTDPTVAAFNGASM
jgi:hypothetical protein